MRIIARFFDRLEDKIRGFLSHYPILYGIIGGVGVVFFWRGIWHGIDFLSMNTLNWQSGNGTVDFANGLDALFSVMTGLILLLVTGLFVSTFIGNEIIISGLRREKKVVDKEEAELFSENIALQEIKQELRAIRNHLENISNPRS